MSEHQVYERYIWFDKELRKNRYPNAASLARQFEICNKSAQRNIRKMQDYIGAPFEYDPSRKGYFYPHNNFSLPELPITENELLAVLLAQNLLVNSAGGVISREISSFGNKLLTTVSQMGFDKNKLRESFSATWNGYSPANGETFRILTNALLHHHTVHFSYYSPEKDQHSERTVNPHHLHHYNGSWMLLAWCHLRRKFLTFSLARIDDPKPTGIDFTPSPKTEWQNQIVGAYGIFQGMDRSEIVLRFSPYRARWIRKELWHCEQQVAEEADGALIMRLQVTDFREIKLRILQYGADVEVLAPAALREEITEEIRRMKKIYADS